MFEIIPSTKATFLLQNTALIYSSSNSNKTDQPDSSCHRRLKVYLCYFKKMSDD